MIITVAAALTFLNVSCGQKSESVDRTYQVEKIQQLEEEVYLLSKRICDLEDQLKALQKSHELAVFVNQDLDERLARVEGKSRL